MRISRFLFLLVSILVLCVLIVAPVAGAGGFIKAASNPVVMPAPSTWENNGVGGACVIFDGSADLYKMWYTGIDTSGIFVFQIGYATSNDGTSWTKSLNPVLSPSAGWELFGVGGPCVIKEGPASYKMWYTGIDASLIPQIGYATSNNGTVWTKYLANPVLIPGAAGWDKNGVALPCVINDSGTYKTWYTGRDASNGVGLLKELAIGYAESADGINWTKSLLNPVLTKTLSSWDDRCVGACCVMKTGTSYYTMYYTGFPLSGGVESRIGEATSSDGISWTKSGNPVLDTGPSGQWDDYVVAAPSVLRKDGIVKMWYTGAHGTLMQIGEAETPPPVPSSSNLGIGLMIGGLGVLIILLAWSSRRYHFFTR